MRLLEPPGQEQAEGYRWVLHTEADPNLPARVLGHFTVRNELPWYFRARRLSEDSLRIEIRASRPSEACARYLAQRLRGIPTVIEAALWAPDGRALSL